MVMNIKIDDDDTTSAVLDAYIHNPNIIYAEPSLKPLVIMAVANVRNEVEANVDKVDMEIDLIHFNLDGDDQ